MSNRVSLIKGNDLSVIESNQMQVIPDPRQMSLFEAAGTAAPASFDPLSLNPILWLDASDTDTITAAAGKVSQWDDKSTSGFNVTQGTTAKMPTTGTLTINSLNVLDWGSSINDINLTTTESGQNWQDIYIVGRYDEGASFTTSFTTLVSAYSSSGSPSSGLCLLSKAATTTELLSSAKWWDNVLINDVALSSPFAILPALNSAALISCSADSSISVNGLCIGADRKGGGGQANRGWKGVIAEIFCFGSKLSDGDRTELVSYINSKWGL